MNRPLFPRLNRPTRRCLAALASSLVALLALPGGAAAQTGETYYVPMPATHVRVWAQAIQNLPENNEFHSVISITVTAPDTQIYYDHWEDGFEFDITDPAAPAAGAGAEIWGDDDCGNGYRPDAGSCTDGNGDDVFLPGDVLVLQSDVPVPGGVRNPAQLRFDGGDKLFATDLLAVTRAAWPSTGVQAQLGGAVEVFRVDKWSDAFESPVGTNMGIAAFEFVGLSIMAHEDGTRVEIDTNADGTIDQTYTLDEGESVLVQPVSVGATVAASPATGVGTRTVQVGVLTANQNTTYEGRWYSLVPTADWDNVYYAPAANTLGTNQTYIYVYNPGPGAITVTEQTLANPGGVNFNVAAGATVQRTLPLTTPISAARYSTAGAPFFAVSATGVNSTLFDWGYTLIPESSLTPAAVVGWAPGSTDLSQNVSPVWVTPVNAPVGGCASQPGVSCATLYVDFDGDPMTGTLTDPNGNRYDIACEVANLQSVRVFDDGTGTPAPPGGSCFVAGSGGDNDQTGARIYTVDGTKIAAAWGQDASLGASGQPQQLDMGTTVVPFSSLNAFKDGALLVDLNGNGGIDIGDTILYTTVIRNTGITPILEVLVTDTLDSGTAYVPGTFEVDGVSIADDGTGTAYPLDTDSPHTSGFVLVEAPDTPAIPDSPVYATPFVAGGAITLTYQVVVLASATDPIINTVVVTSTSETFVDTSTNPIPSSVLSVSKSSDAGGDVMPGQTFEYTVTVTNPSSAAVTGVRITDALPAGTSYVAESTSVTGPRQLFVADRFGTVTPFYGNNDGPNSWGGAWTEAGDGGTNPAAGDIQVEIGPGGGELRLDNQSGGAAANIGRPVDLSAYATSDLGVLRFGFRVDSGVDENENGNGDAIAVECSANGGTSWTTLGYMDWLNGSDTPLVSGTAMFDVSPCISANTQVRFRVDLAYGGANEFFYVDNVELRTVDLKQTSAEDLFSSFPGGGTGLWTGSWTANGGVSLVGGQMRLLDNGTAGAASREVDLSAGTFGERVLALLAFNLRTGSSNDGPDVLEVQARTDSSAAWTTLAAFNDETGYYQVGNPGGSGFRSFDLTRFVSSTTQIRFIITAGTTSGNEYFEIDNLRIITGAQDDVTKDNVPGGGNDLVDGDPSMITLPSDSFALAPGESLTATFEVTADDPLNLTRIINTVGVAAHENTQRVYATVLDPVSPGAQIGDRVWLDTDGDGVQDVGEPGLAGVTVELRDGVCTPGSTCPTALTDGNGQYLFDRLRPGTYNVVVISGVPGGLSASPGNPPSSLPVTITNGDEVFRDIDFGYRPATGTGVLGDRVWADADGDGIQDPGELGIGGVTVQRRTAGADGIFGNGDDVVVSTTTADDGSYLFTSVPPGQYVIQVSGGPLGGRTPTTGPQSIGGTTSPPVTVVADQVRTDLDFGFTAPGTFSITDALWVDEDEDGVRDPNERPIPGVTVNLLDNGGNVVGTATSDANGQFTFSGVANGTYTIVVTDNTGKLVGRKATTPNALAGQRAVSVAGGDVTGAHFGYIRPGLIGDRVWSDANGDGVQDAGEAGIAGVSVQLLGPGADGLLFTGDDVVLQTTTTAADGTYEFDQLPPGGYRVRVPSSPAGYSQTGDPNYPNVVCVGGQCDNQGSSTLTLAAVDRNLDFGYRNNALPDVSGNVFEDLDRDGIDDGGGEPGIPAVEIALVAAGLDGLFGTNDDLVVARTTTDGSGNYTFPDVAAGNYQVEVRDGAGVLDAYQLTSGRDQIPITVAAADLTGIDFGYARTSGTGVIGDTLFIDVDPPGPDGPDGLPGPTEPRLPGVTVQLYEDLDGDGVISGGDGAAIATTVTDANGQYQFTGLGAGRYLVDVVEATLPTNLVETTYPAAVTDPNDVINLSDGEVVDDTDFGYRPTAGTGILGDFVWYDANGDGLQDPGEVGIPGVDVILLGPGPDGDPNTTGDNTSVTVTTDRFGHYLFTGVVPEDYVVTFDAATLPVGYNTTPTNTPPGNTAYSVTVAAGDVFSTLDWGFNGGTVGSIGDRVWQDTDGDGLQDPGEPGIPGVTVNLLDNGGNIIATTITTADGSYDFVGLPAGTYQVEVTDIGGVLAGLNLSSGSNPTGSIALAAGQDYNDADFGYAPSGGTGSIGTSLWHDLDFDGLRDPGEPPIEGVTIDVYLDVNNNGILDPGIDNRLRTVVTDANGSFELKGLPFGSYLVDVTDTFGVLAGLQKTIGPSPGSDDNSQADPYAVTLSGGSPNDITADFGYRDVPSGGTASIAGTAFLDADVDGLFDNPPEMVVQGIPVLLFRVLLGGRRALIGQTVTGVNGDYSFTDLAAGNYEVAVVTDGSSVDGFLQTTQTTTGGVQPVTLLASSASTGNDFGFFDGGITTTPVTLSYFYAREENGGLEVEWQTATEVGHVAFDLWVLAADGWTPLGEHALPGSGVDSLEIRPYSLRADAVAGTTFLLEEIDVFGRSRYHGPFQLGEEHGNKELANRPIDWQQIRGEHIAKRAERLSAERRQVQLRAAGGEAKLHIVADGIYRVTYQQLRDDGGLDLGGVAPASIAVTNRGLPVPIRVASLGPFGPGDYLELVAEGLDTLYSRTNVYTVKVDPALARRASDDPTSPGLGAPASSYQERLLQERDLEYSFGSPNGDPWYDTAILASGGPAAGNFSFVPDEWLPGDGPVSLDVGLWGVTDFPQAPDHHVRVELNGVEVADVEFDGLVDHPISAPIADATLLAGSNSLKVELPGDTSAAFDLVCVDSFVVTYPRRFVARSGALTFTTAGSLFEVEGLTSPDVAVYRQVGSVLERLSGVVVSGVPPDVHARFAGPSAGNATYFVASGAAIGAPDVAPGRPLANLTSGEARLLVIAHPDFLDGTLDSLLDRRRAQGWSVKVVDVEDVYAQYGDDLFDPEAIRRYIDFARRNLDTEAVLVVGGDTNDYLDNLGLGGVSFIPSLYGRTGAIVRFAPADGLLADGNGDQVPDVAIGRFPVRTTTELQTLVDRTIAFEEQGDRKSLLLAADGVDIPSRFDFTQVSEQLASRVPIDWQLDRIYLDDLLPAAANAQLVQRLNEGVALTSFMGHSGPIAWTFDGLFSSADAAALDNAGHPTVVAQWGCWTTYYVSPKNETLAHKLLLDSPNGAAAVLGATTLTEARSERAISLQIFDRLFQPGATLGQVILDAKRTLAATGDVAVLDVLLGWNLLGDPTIGGFDGVLGDPTLIFADGFESGDVSRW